MTLLRRVAYGVVIAACVYHAQNVAVAEPSTLPVTRPALSAEETKSIIDSLSNDDWKVRQSAQQQLVALGEEARPVILGLLRQPQSSEARVRLTSALSQIDDNRMVGASTISMHFDQASPKEVFAQLSQQCYAQLTPFPENLWEQGKWPTVTLNIDHEPFWSAINEIARQTGADLQPFGNGVHIARGNGFRAQGQSQIQGPFLVVATQLNRSETVLLGKGAGGTQSEFQLQLTVYSEPKVRVLQHASAVVLDVAIDNKGNNLIYAGGDARAYSGGTAGMWNVYAQLLFPQNPGARIVHIRGSTTVVIQTQSHTLEVPDVLSAVNVTQTIGGLPVTINSMKKAGDVYELGVTVVRDPNDPRWTAIQQGIDQRLKVFDSAGRAMDYRGMSSRGGNISMEYMLRLSINTSQAKGQPPAVPSKLVWDIPTASRTVTVPFDFKDLPMPR